MLKPTRTRPCPQCSKSTEQTLEPTAEGSGWICRATGEAHVAQAYSPDDMLSLLRAVAATAPKKQEMPRPSTAGLRVFLEHPSGEAELAPQFVELHVELTGALPKVGEPMITRARGLPAPLNTIPYGKVVRVECTPQSK